MAEDGLTFLANAERKAHAFADAARLPALADDSGLVVDALGGEPGVLSARFGGGELTAAERNQVLLRSLEGVGERRARYICVLCLGEPGGAPGKVFVGQCEGRIGREPRGGGGFGYDPIFVLPDGRSMAELPDGEKDQISHRGRAVREMLAAVDMAGWASAVARGLPPVTSQAT